MYKNVHNIDNDKGFKNITYDIKRIRKKEYLKVKIIVLDTGYRYFYYMNKLFDAVIVGAGPAGLMAAIVAARRGRRVVLLELQDRSGRKILSTGNGRCNFTNISCEKHHFHGPHSEFIATVLNSFNSASTIDFFKELGVLPYIEDGRVYPASQHASSIRDALSGEIDRLKIPCEYGVHIKELKACSTGFEIYSNVDVYTGTSVLLATGLHASAHLGGGADGLRYARMLNVHCQETFPALVPLRVEAFARKQSHGVRAEVLLTVIADGQRIFSEKGEALFTDYGVSGIVALSASYFVNKALVAHSAVSIELDLLPDVSRADLENHILYQQSTRPTREVSEFLCGSVNRKLVPTIVDACGLSKDVTLAKITSSELNGLVRALKSLSGSVSGTLSPRQAQVMGGGVDTLHMRPETMESNVCKGLYCAGEMCDVVGDCGGYNLQWAWSSGYSAGMAV